MNRERRRARGQVMALLARDMTYGVNTPGEGGGEDQDKARILEYYKYNAFGSVTVLPVYDRDDSIASSVNSSGVFDSGIDDIPGSGSRTEWDLVENTPLTLDDNNTLMTNRRNGDNGHVAVGAGYGRGSVWENDICGRGLTWSPDSGCASFHVVETGPFLIVWLPPIGVLRDFYNLYMSLSYQGEYFCDPIDVNATEVTYDEMYSAMGLPEADRAPYDATKKRYSIVKGLEGAKDNAIWETHADEAGFAKNIRWDIFVAGCPTLCSAEAKLTQEVFAFKDGPDKVSLTSLGDDIIEALDGNLNPGQSFRFVWDPDWERAPLQENWTMVYDSHTFTGTQIQQSMDSFKAHFPEYGLAIRRQIRVIVHGTSGSSVWEFEYIYYNSSKKSGLRPGVTVIDKKP